MSTAICAAAHGAALLGKGFVHGDGLCTQACTQLRGSIMLQYQKSECQR